MANLDSFDMFIQSDEFAHEYEEWVKENLLDEPEINETELNSVESDKFLFMDEIIGTLGEWMSRNHIGISAYISKDIANLYKRCVEMEK